MIHEQISLYDEIYASNNMTYTMNCFESLMVWERVARFNTGV